MSNVRSKAIRLAASMPKGSSERKALLNVLAKTPRPKSAAGSMEDALQPGLDKFTTAALKHIVGFLKAKGAHITDVQAENSNTVTFKIREKPGKINVFADLTGGKTNIEVRYSGKKDWSNSKIPLNITRDSKDFAESAFYAIPSALLS